MYLAPRPSPGACLPHLAPLTGRARVAVLVVVIVGLMVLLHIGYPLPTAVTVLLLGGFVAAEICQRLSGVPVPQPRLW